MKSIPKKIWITAFILMLIGALFIYNRPVDLKKAVLMSTPLIFREGLMKPYDDLPDDITPPAIEVFYATDRQPTDKTLLYPIYHGNDRSMSLYLGTATVRIGAEDMGWEETEQASLMKERTLAVPMQIEGTEILHEIGSASKSLEASLWEQKGIKDHFLERIKSRLSYSKHKTIYIFVPGFKVDFAYPVLVAAELWHYMGYPGAFIAYSWPSRQRIRDYFSDMETAAFTAQHFRLLLNYLAEKTEVEKIHIVSYSAGARIVSQALHEMRLTASRIPVSQLKRILKIGQVIFTAPDIDMMLFAARYRDGFEDIADTNTIYTNANDTALHWALRFFGWPRLGAPGELGLTPGDLRSLNGSEKTVIIDVAGAEDAASGNGHGYFIKSPWVSTDLLLTLKFGLKPGKRGLSWGEVDAAWNFPNNYPQMVRQIVEQIH
ncbi:MAG: alpha/beta hydrolase [Deltaproteobacteria bacterium]|nr:alpha/beta hydrolase [Deltaproteobacteria bacterium]